MMTEEIDVMKIYAKSDYKAWNEWLQKCLTSNNLNELIKVRRGLQVGISSAQKKGLVDEKFATTFARWINSIDRTVRKLIRDREGSMQAQDKKNLDNEVEKFLKRESF